MKCLLTIREDAAGVAVADTRCLTLPFSALVHAALAAGVLMLPALLSRELPQPKAGWISVPVVWPEGGNRAAAGGGGGAGAAIPPVFRDRRLAYQTQTRSAVSKAATADLDSVEIDLSDEGGDSWCVGNCRGKWIGDGQGSEPPKLPAATPTPEPVRAGLGGIVREPHKVRHVEPIYPVLARSARIQGRVVLECTLTPSGTVAEIAVVEGNPLLSPAAVSAVGQWQYRPTLLNGTPVAVRLSVVVDFRLS